MPEKVGNSGQAAGRSGSNRRGRLVLEKRMGILKRATPLACPPGGVLKGAPVVVAAPAPVRFLGPFVGRPRERLSTRETIPVSRRGIRPTGTEIHQFVGNRIQTILRGEKPPVR